MSLMNFFTITVPYVGLLGKYRCGNESGSC